MELIIKLISADINYHAAFKEPILSAAIDKPRVALIEKIMKSFHIRLNDIKFNNVRASDDFIHFYKFFGKCFFDASFGLEEVAARIGTPEDEAQVIDLLKRFCNLFKDYRLVGVKL